MGSVSQPVSPGMCMYSYGLGRYCGSVVLLSVPVSSLLVEGLSLCHGVLLFSVMCFFFLLLLLFLWVCDGLGWAGLCYWLLCWLSCFECNDMG